MYNKNLMTNNQERLNYRAMSKNPIVIDMVIGDLLKEVEESLTELFTNERKVLVIFPEDGVRLLTMKGADKVADFSPQDVVLDCDLLVRFNPENIMMVGSEVYLVGPLMVLELDENGNYCDPTEQTLKEAASFYKDARIGIQLGSDKPVDTLHLGKLSS